MVNNEMKLGLYADHTRDRIKQTNNIDDRAMSSRFTKHVSRKLY